MSLSICADPTPEEVAQAKELVDGMNKDDHKKGLANMSYWLKSSGHSGLAKGVRGAMRHEWFMQFMIMKSREKTAQATSVHTVTHTKRSSKDTEVKFMSKFQLEQTIGSVKAGAWIESGKLSHQPDSVTGQDTEWMREYKVIFVGGKISEEATIDLALKIETEVKAEEVETMTGMIQGLGQEPTMHPEPLANGNVPIKQEPGVNVIVDPAKDLARTQSQLLDVKTMRSKAYGMRYADCLMKDMDSLVVSLNRNQKSLEALIINARSTPDMQAMGRLKVAVTKSDSSYADIMNWAQRFGIESTKKPKKQKTTK